ncbi:MAG: SpoIIE family protein phosphatase [Armatimonadota bacterium]|nr:SpoIIE family protein phosphatase [Armatimonadota bacterium]
MKRLLHTNSIRSKLTLYLLAVFLALSLLHWKTYYVGYQDQQQLIQSTQEQSNSDAARMAALAIDSLTSGTARVQMAAAPSVLSRVGRPASASRYLRSICRTDEHSLSYSFLSPSGRVTASSDATLIGADLSASEDVRIVLHGQSSRLSDLHLSNGRRCFAITTAVRPGGKLRGMMRTEVSAEALAELLVLKTSPGAVVVAVDREGSRIYGKNGLQSRLGRGSTERTRFVRKALSNRGPSFGSFSTTVDNGRLIGCAVPVRMGGWAVIAARPVEFNTGRAAAYFTRGFYYSLICTAAILIVFWWQCGSWLTGNLRRLARVASALAVGDLGKRVNIKTDDELEVLSTSFNRMADSLQEHEKQVRSKSEALQGLLDVSRVVTSSLDLGTVVAGISQAVARRFGAESVAVYVYNEDVNRLELLACHNCSNGSSDNPPAEWEAMASKAHKRRSLVSVEPAEEAPGFGTRASRNNPDASGSDAREAEGPGLIVAVPLVASDRPAGVLVATLQREDVADDDSRNQLLELLQAFGSHAAVALQNAQAHARTEEVSMSLAAWLDELSALRYVTEGIAASLDLSEVLRTLARLTCDVMKAQSCAIMLMDAGGALTVSEAHNLNPAMWNDCACRIGEPISGLAAARKHPTLCRDLLEEYPDHPMAAQAAASGLRGFLSVPLIFGKEALGTIDIWMAEVTDFTAYQLDLLSSIAAHSAMVIQNARLFGKEYRIAETLQSVLLANIPSRLNGVELGCKYVPALDEAHVGGDFYDAIPLPGGKLGVVIADVSGKGLSAAVHTAMGKYMLRAFAYHLPDQPARVLEMVNAAITGYGELRFYISVFYCVIDPASGEMVYANAGHPPTIWISDDGLRQSLLYQTGMPCGLEMEAVYEQKSIRLQPEDLLVLYTDGLMDARRGAETLGIEGLQEILFSAAEERDPQAIVERLHTEALRYAEDAVRDDMAIVAVRAYQIGGGGDVDPGESWSAREGGEQPRTLEVTDNDR